MTGDATHIIFGMFRVDSIHVLRTAGMAVEAPRVNLPRRSVLEGENFTLVSTPINVRLPRTVTCFASVPFRAPLGIERGYEMRRSLVVLEEILRRHVLVARLASFRTHIQRWVRGALILRTLFVLFFIRVLIGFGRFGLGVRLVGESRDHSNEQQA